MPQTIIYLLSCFVAGTVLGWILFKLIKAKSYIDAALFNQLREEKQKLEISIASLTTEKQTLLGRQQELQQELRTGDQQNRKLQEQLQTLNTTIVRLEADVHNRQERLDTQKHDLEEMKL